MLTTTLYTVLLALMDTVSCKSYGKRLLTLTVTVDDEDVQYCVNYN